MIRSIRRPLVSPLWEGVIGGLPGLCAVGLLAVLLAGLPGFLAMPPDPRADGSALGCGALWGYLCAGSHGLDRRQRWLAATSIPAIAVGAVLLVARYDPALASVVSGTWKQARYLAHVWATGSLPAIPARAGWVVLWGSACALAAAVFACLRDRRPLPALLVAGVLLYGQWAFQQRGVDRAGILAAAFGVFWLSLSSAGDAVRRPVLDRGPSPVGLLARALLAAMVVLVLAFLPVRLPPPDLAGIGAWTDSHAPVLGRLFAGTRLGAGGARGPAPLGTALSPTDAYGLQAEGFGASDANLGGPLQTSGAEAMRLTVLAGTAPRTIYLQGLVLDTYTGRGWVESPTRLRSATPPARLHTGLGGARRGRFFALRRAFTVRLQPTGLVTSSLFTIPDTRALSVAALSWDRLGNAWLSAPLAPGAAYQVTAVPPRDPRQLAALPPGFSGRFFGFARPFGFAAARASADPPGPGDLQLPASLPSEVRQLAVAWTSGATTPLQRALAIERHLLRIPYSLDAPAPPAGSDFVDFFLFRSHEGYCTYYASAMAVMLRSLGIPARWATGFAVPAPPSGQVTSVTDAEAHAWVEAFVPPYGWLVFDPTPPGPTLRPAPAAATASQSAVPPPPVPTLAAASSAGPFGSAVAWRRGLLAVVLAGLVAVAAVALRAWRWRVWEGRDPIGSATRLWTLFRRSGGPRARHADELTPAEYADAVGRRWPYAAAACGGLADAYGRLRYGRPADRAAAAADLRAAWLAWRRHARRARLRWLLRPR